MKKDKITKNSEAMIKVWKQLKPYLKDDKSIKLVFKIIDLNVNRLRMLLTSNNK